MKTILLPFVLLFTALLAGFASAADDSTCVANALQGIPGVAQHVGACGDCQGPGWPGIPITINGMHFCVRCGLLSGFVLIP
jgi:hypothetical protein